MLAAGIDSLVDEERGFRTFFFPAERDGENWNFYSGEALLFWAETARMGHPVAPTLERCAVAFERCRERHRRKRNPAFVPWHTQASASLYAQTGRREYADFVLEMNDWLLPMQQWDGLDPDLKGRFHNPRRPDFGPRTLPRRELTSKASGTRPRSLARWGTRGGPGTTSVPSAAGFDRCGSCRFER